MSNNINKLKNCSTIPGTYPLHEFCMETKGMVSPLYACIHKEGIFEIIFFITSIIFFLSAIYPSSAFAGTLSIAELTTKIQSAYESTLDLRAAFLQEVSIKSMKKTEREEGIVWMKNPQMMYWDYKKPKIKKLIINAKKAWLYVDEDKIVYVQNADAVYNSRLVIKFLSGIGKLSEDFSVDFAKKEHTNPSGDYLLRLTAKDHTAGIGTIRLTIDKKTFQITNCRFEDDYGNITNLSFHDIRINTGISDSFFTFKPTSDTETVNMP